MATLSNGAFRFLSLCASRPGSAAVAQRLSSALEGVRSFDELAIAGEQHGLEPLALAQHAHAAAVQARVFADVAGAMAQAGVLFLVLKGAALAHLVYDEPRLRPMRDVDLLVRKDDVRTGARHPDALRFQARQRHRPAASSSLAGNVKDAGGCDRQHRAGP